MESLSKTLVEDVTKKLIALKKRANLYNVSVNEKGLSWSMAITTYDGKPFQQKEVRITAHCGMQQKVVNVITPKQAGYTLKEVSEMYNV